MNRGLKLLLVSLLVCAALGGAALAQGPQPLPPPVPAGVAPQWAPAPGSPKVAYAPNIGADLFQSGPRFFYFYGGQWYRGKSLYGPWHPVRQLPPRILKLHRSAFKSAPPW